MQMNKIDRNMSQFWQAACKNIILISVRLLVLLYIYIYIFLFRNQQLEYLGTLWADVLAVSRDEVPSSEEISVVDSINCWLMFGSS